MLTIVAVKSKVNGRWNYCPKSAYETYFKLAMDYSEDSGYWTAEDAIDGAHRDKSIPKGARFEVAA